MSAEVSYGQLGQAALEIQRLAYEIALSGDHTLGGNVADSETPQATADLFFGDIPELFAPFINMPQPGHLIAPRDLLDAALKAIAPCSSIASSFGGGLTYLAQVDLTGMTMVQQQLSGWVGPAAGEFVRNFATPFPNAMEKRGFAGSGGGCGMPGVLYGG